MFEKSFPQTGTRSSRKAFFKHALRHLYIFTAVYQEMSITRVAEWFHLVQSRVSQAVKELKAEYGEQLFEKLNRKLFVKEKGK